MCGPMMVLILALASLGTPTEGEDTVPALLARYRQGQQVLQSAIIKSSQAFEYRWSIDAQRTKKMYTSTEMYLDADRHRTITRSWGDISPVFQAISEDRPLYRSALWDGSTNYFYNRAHAALGKLHITRQETIKDNPALAYMSRLPNSTVLGYFLSTERIDQVLESAGSAVLRGAKERVGDYDCYVIDASTKGGKIAVWIDPAHGYNIAKAEIRKGPGDGTGQSMPRDRDSQYLSFEVDSFREVDGAWVMAGAEIRAGEVHGADSWDSQSRYSLTDIVLHPDHETLRSFVPDDVRDGATVTIEGVPGIVYTWQNGELIPNVDEYVIGAIDKVADELMAGNSPTGGSIPWHGVAEHPTARTLLDEYSKTQGRLRSFTAQARTEVSSSRDTKNTSSRVEWCEFGTDGTRACYRRLADNPESPAQALLLADGEQLIDYRARGDSGRGMVDVKEPSGEEIGLIMKAYRGAPLMGYYLGDTQRVDDLLRRAELLSVRLTTENVDGIACFVVEGSLAGRSYAVWIAPARDYNIAGITIHASQDNRTLLFSLQKVQFEQRDGTWVPMAAEIAEQRGTAKTTWSHKRIRLVLNPDHEALGSFVPRAAFPMERM